ncbi:LPXTG cell wall anchor domain-containing protein [Yinghuangia aomiensis]|uniref:LPXTG cell wall anchor domain-containing protein n=1 Tax=Yinghuangia aomiensis TaxID=676205 RepID=UPI0031E7EFBC
MSDAFTGAPKQIVAGAAPVEFNAVLTNSSDQDILFTSELFLDSTTGPVFTLKPEQVKLEYYDEKTSKWVASRYSPDSGAPITSNTLDWGTARLTKPGTSWTIKLRLAFTADVPGRSMQARLGTSPASQTPLNWGNSPARPATFDFALKAAAGNSPKPPTVDPSLPTQPANPGSAVVQPNSWKGNGPAVAFSGLPGNIVVGAQPAEFRVTLKNTTGEAIGFTPSVSLTSAAGGAPLRASQVDLQAQGLGSTTWGKVHLFEGPGADDDPGSNVVSGWFGVQDPEDPNAWTGFDMAPGQEITLNLRVAFSKDAPLGQTVGLVIGLGAGESEQDYLSYSDYYVFNLVAAGQERPVPGDVVLPKPPKKIPGKPKAGQQLAATGGNDSSATTWAVAGGAALVGGAGLLVVMRRRKAGTAA